MRRGIWGRPFLWYPLWWRPLLWFPWIIMTGGFMFLLYDAMAYKLYREDVARIERETGRPARELTEGELLAAMRRLGIQKLELTPEDREVITRKQRARYCIHCGAKLSLEAAYCSECGRKIF